MEACFQLELNLDDRNSEEMKIVVMQKQIDAMADSFGKVRRKLFGELGDMRKLCNQLIKENENLKAEMREIKNEKICWDYNTTEYLFEMQELAN